MTRRIEPDALTAVRVIAQIQRFFRFPRLYRTRRFWGRRKQFGQHEPELNLASVIDPAEAHRIANG